MRTLLRTGVAVGLCVSLLTPLSGAAPVEARSARLSKTTLAAVTRPVRAQVKEPARVRPSAPPASAIRPKIMHGVRPPMGRHVAGPPMLRPSELNGAIRAAAARARSLQSTFNAPGVPAPVGGARRGAAPRLPGSPPAGQASAVSGARQTQSLPSDPNGSGTGINRWWRYQEENVPGGGHLMVNVGTGNLLLQDDDMSIAHKGIALAFRRTYNSQSLHNVNGGDSGHPSMYGNGWTNTFDAHITKPSASHFSLYDIDGARYDYHTPGFVPGQAQTLISDTVGNHNSLVYDGSCGMAWTKKSGTVYYFYAPKPNTTCPAIGLVGAYGGRLYQIVGRNNNTWLSFSYTWDNGDASDTGKVNQITAQTESGMTTTLTFTDVAGYRLLQQLTFPDGTTSVIYNYDANGNLTAVSRPPNDASGIRPTQAFGYQALGSDFVMSAAASPRAIASCAANGCINDGGVLWFGYAGTGALNSTVSTIQTQALVNPTIPDGISPGPLQGSGYSGLSFIYNIEYYTSGVTTPTYRDTDGHITNWVFDGNGRPMQTQQCTSSLAPALQCVDSDAHWLVANESWDANNNLISTTDARGYETDYAYDTNGNVVAIGAPTTTTSQGTFRPTKLFDYDAFNNVVASCDETETHLAGADWSATPASSDSLCAGAAANVAHWAAAFTYPTYQPYGQLSTMRTPLGYTHHFAYSPAQQGGTDFGLPTSVAGDAMGQLDGSSITPTQTFWYDASGNLGCYSKGNGLWSLRYDALMRLVAVADPDDTSLNAGSLCGKTSGMAGWNTQTTYAYFPDGAKQSAQTASERPFGVSTTYAYDLDGNVVGETAHHGCVQGQPCPDGTTQKWYDGSDRLVEVQLPHDPRSYSNPTVGYDAQPWVTRYFYDITQGGTVSVTSSPPFRAYGNLFRTQSGDISGFVDKNGTQFDALDREVAKYSWAIPSGLLSGGFTTDTLEVAQLIYDTGPVAAPGMLTQKIDPLGETTSFGYDALGRILTKTFGNDGGRTANETYAYDPNGRALSVTSSQFGVQQYTYDLDGRLANSTEPSGGGITDPAQLTYSYYADGKRSAVSVTSSTFGQTNALAYSYRADGLLQTQTLNAFAPGTWSRTYTDAGRKSVVSGAASEAVAYDTTGQIQGNTMAGQTVTFTHDPEGSMLTELAPSTTGTETVTNTVNVRGELADSFYSPVNFLVYPHYRSTTPGGCIMRDSIPYDGSYVPGVVPQMAGYDARSCVLVSNGTMGTISYNEIDYPSGGTNNFTFDSAGRLTRSVSRTSVFNDGGNAGLPPLDPTGDPGFGNHGQTTPGTALTTVTTTDTTYDAENHTVSRHASLVRTLTKPDTGSRTTTTLDNGTTTLGWGPNGHPLVVGQGTPAALTLHWDGDMILFVTDLAGNVVDFKAGLDGEVTPRIAGMTGLNVYYRDHAGVIIGSVGNGLTQFQPLDPIDGSGMPTATPAYAQYVRSDGFMIYGIQINGVRAFDAGLQSWTTPDAFEGDIHDPASQQKYMWNRGNAIDYSDPSGFAPQDTPPLLLLFPPAHVAYSCATNVDDCLSVAAIVLTAGECGKCWGSGGLARAEANAERAAELHGGHDPIAGRMRTTAVSTTSEGRTLVTTSTTKRPASGVQSLAGSDEEMVVAPRGTAREHAETKALRSAKAGGARLSTMGVTRQPCPPCASALRDEGTIVKVQKP